MSSYVNKFFSAVGSALEFNAATLSGAIDIIVVEDDDGVRRCSPFHVRFGKLQLLKSRGMAVDIWLNDVKTDLTLRLGTAGEAYFVAPDPEGGASTPRLPANPSLAIEEGGLSTPLVPDAVATATAEPTFPRTSPPAGAGEPNRVLSSAHDGDLGADRPSGLGTDVAANEGGIVASDVAAGPETEADATAAAVAAVGAPTCGSVNRGVTAEAGVEAGVEAGADAHAVVVWTPTGAVGAVADITCVAASQLCRGRELAGVDALGCSSGVACSASRQTAAVAPVDVTAAAPGPAVDPAVSAVCPDGAPADATESSATPLLPVGAPSTPPPPSSQNDPTAHSLSFQRSWRQRSASKSSSRRRRRRRRSVSQPAGVRVPLLDQPPTGHTRSFSVSHPPDVAVGLRGTDAAAATASSSALPLRQPLDPGGSSRSLVVHDVIEREAVDDASQSSSVGEDVLALSLCGSFITPTLAPAEVMAVFDMHRVAYSEFAASPSRILANPDLRCRVDGRLVPWAIAAPYVVSMLAYGVPLDLDRLTSPCGTGTTADVSEERRVVLETEAKDAAAAAKAEAAAAAPPSSVNGEPRRRFSWFGLRSSYSQPDVDRSAAEQEVVPSATEASSTPGLWSSVTSADETDRSSGERLASTSAKGSTASSPPPGDDDGSSGDAESGGGEDGGRDVTVATSSDEHRRTTKREVTSAVAAAVKGAVSHPLHPMAAADAAATAVEVAAEGGELLPRGRLSMRPTATELSSLPLRPGANDVRFVVRSSLQGIQEVSAKLFLWHAHDKVVVSDVDGTITRSDLLGHLLPRVGRDWSHSGVAGLYTRIARNGYKLVYLTARPIGQAASTRAFLASLTQARGRQLPLGPLVMSPDRLVESLTREVIRRTPHEFKIAALRDIQRLFVPDDEDGVTDDVRRGAPKDGRLVGEDFVTPTSAVVDPTAPVPDQDVSSSSPAGLQPDEVPTAPTSARQQLRSTSTAGSGEATPEGGIGSSSLLRSFSEGNYGVKKLVSSIPAISLGPASPATAFLAGDRLDPPEADGLYPSATGPLPTRPGGSVVSTARLDLLSSVATRTARSSTPFHAGFGNRATDELSYRTVGLPPQRIFTINPAGELACMNALYESTCSYSNLETLVESVFPDVGVRPQAQGGDVGGGGGAFGRSSGSSAERDSSSAIVARAVAASDTYNDFHYWKPQLPAVAADEFDNLL